MLKKLDVNKATLANIFLETKTLKGSWPILFSPMNVVSMIWRRM